MFKNSNKKQLMKILLICGILSPLLYAAADISAGLLWQGYSFRDQAISELGAVGAPSSLIFSAILIVVYICITAFGIGVWKSAEEKKQLRIAGGLLIALGVMALTIGMFVPMQLRGSEQGLSGALHLIEGMLAMILIFTAMGFAATAFGSKFRFYTIFTIIIAIAFGAWAGMDAPLVEQGLSTPWLGVKERIFWYAYQSWYIVLAYILLRQNVQHHNQKHAK